MQHPPAPGQPSGPLQRSGVPQPNCPLPEGNLAIFDFEISLFKLLLPQAAQVRPLILSLLATICSLIWAQSAHWNSYNGIAGVLYSWFVLQGVFNLLILH